MIIPFLSPAGGSSQDAVTLVEVILVKLKLAGCPEGAEEKQCNDKIQQLINFHRIKLENVQEKTY